MVGEEKEGLEMEEEEEEEGSRGLVDQTLGSKLEGSR